MSTVVSNPWIDYLRDVVAHSQSRDASCHAGTNAPCHDLDERSCSSQTSESQSQDALIEVTNNIRELRSDLDRITKDVRALYQIMERNKVDISETRRYMTDIWDHVKCLTQWTAEAQERINRHCTS